MNMVCAYMYTYIYIYVCACIDIHIYIYIYFVIFLLYLCMRTLVGLHRADGRQAGSRQADLGGGTVRRACGGGMRYEKITQI